jgi:hypothetical protein
VVRVQDGRPAAEGFRHVAVAETEADPLSLGRHLEMTLTACLDVFTHHYLQARNQLPVAGCLGWRGAPAAARVVLVAAFSGVASGASNADPLPLS